MVEVTGDVVSPVELIIPQQHGDTTDGSTTKPLMSGAILQSGGKLYFYTGVAIEQITSTA